MTAKSSLYRLGTLAGLQITADQTALVGAAALALVLGVVALVIGFSTAAAVVGAGGFMLNDAWTSMIRIDLPKSPGLGNA